MSHAHLCVRARARAMCRQCATDCGDGDWHGDEDEDDCIDGVVFLCVYARDAGRDRGIVRVRVRSGDEGDEQTRVGVGE